MLKIIISSVESVGEEMLPFLPWQCVAWRVGVQGPDLDPLLPLEPGLSLGEGRGRLGGRGLPVLLGLPPPVQAVLALQAPDVGVKVWLRSEVT